VAGQLGLHGALDKGVVLSTRRPCPGRYSKGLFCEIVTKEVYFLLKFFKKVIFVDYAGPGPVHNKMKKKDF
jgi:hypothetical protein